MCRLELLLMFGHLVMQTSVATSLPEVYLGIKPRLDGQTSSMEDGA